MIFVWFVGHCEQALRALKHSSIIHCKEYIFEEKSRRAHLVFEFMDMGSLERVCRLRTTPFTDAELRSIVYQVLCGLEFMHRQGFIHRDIKVRSFRFTFTTIYTDLF